jgi:PEP-CTERM motif
MRRIAVVLGRCMLLLPMAAWADPIFINQFGSITITNTGIVSTGSELMRFNEITAPPGHSLGSVSFSTGALTSGSIWSGGTFSSTGSSFVVIGVGKYGEPRGTIFAGSFVGPIRWKVVSHTGKYDYVFTLSGVVSGESYTGRFITGTTKQTIYVSQNQWFQDHRGGIRLGTTNFRVGLPEPGTLGLFGTGLIVLAGAMRRKLFGA